ncbi:MAG: serine hydrolase [Chitinophagaceae bacterium]|nr:serine hydrolase [Chitinophagaceae bacterium]
MLAKKLAFSLLALLSYAPAVMLPEKAVAQDVLPRGVPEKEGVSSTSIMDFLDAAGRSHTEFHSFMYLRHGKVIAEGWWNPYSPSLKHTLYSTSKSFTAAAVGFAIAEKKLKLTDKVISFFPNEVPNPMPQHLADLTVKDVLIMSDGMDPDPTHNVVGDSNWVRTFFATPVLNVPGTKFLYNSAGTYMLSAIVTKVTGQKVVDYLRPRLFEPLGIYGADWEVSPQGDNTGGWGLRLKTEDMAKFGQLYLRGGSWKDKQLLPKKWVKEATTMQILQDPSAPQAKRDSSDWLQGYCYQMWRCRHNGVRADGAFGQFIIILPDQDVVIAIQAETPDMQEEINLVWQYLLPGMQDRAYKDDPDNNAKLKLRLAALALPPRKGGSSPANFSINGRTYTLQDNPKKTKSIGFTIQDSGIWQITLKDDKGAYTIPFGHGKWARAETPRSGPSLLTGAVSHDLGLPPFQTAGSFYWIDENTLELVLRYIESPHTERMVCHFNGNDIRVEDTNSFEYGKGGAVLTGTLQ